MTTENREYGQHVPRFCRTVFSRGDSPIVYHQRLRAASGEHGEKLLGAYLRLSASGYSNDEILGLAELGTDAMLKVARCPRQIITDGPPDPKPVEVIIEHNRRGVIWFPWKRK